MKTRIRIVREENGSKPAITVKTYRASTESDGAEIEVNGKVVARVVYRSGKPLLSGDWSETVETVECQS